MAIISIIMMSLIPFAWDIIGGSVKSSTQQEVSSQARFISERIKYEIRNANNINNVTANSISLDVNPPNNPTVIDTSGGNIRITQGVANPVNLNSPTTTISSLSFTDYTSADGTTKHIGFLFTIDDAFGSSRQEYQVPAMTIESSAELRSH